MALSTWLSELIRRLSYGLILIAAVSLITTPFSNVQSLLPWISPSPTFSYQPTFFVNVTQPDGETLVCAADTPYTDAVVANGKTCAKSCVMTPYCKEFNFMSDTNRCQLFTQKPVKLWPSTDGCIYYQMIDPDNRDCADIWADGATQDGVYVVYQGDPLTPMTVYCSQGWTVFQNRFDGSQDFDLSYSDYTLGFGNWTSEFWMGLEHMVTIMSTPGRNYSLQLDMVDFSNHSKFALYNEAYMYYNQYYYLNLEDYNSTSTVAGDSLFTSRTISSGSYTGTLYCNNQQFHVAVTCGENYGGGWWYCTCNPNFNNCPCFRANLNGNRFPQCTTTGYCGMSWYYWTSNDGNGSANLIKSAIKVLPKPK